MAVYSIPQSLRYIVGKAGKGGEASWLPLWMHARDTAGVIEWLADHWLPESVYEVLLDSGKSGRMTKKELKRLVRFLGYIHDEGKLLPYFQCLIVQNIPEILGRLKEDGISILPWDQYETAGSNHAYLGELFLRKYHCPKGAASIVGSHHGMTQEVSEMDIKQVLGRNGRLAKNLYGNDESRWETLRYSFLEWALAESGYSDISEVPELFQRGQILLTGLLIMADWIASNETYFPLLPLSEEGDEDYYPHRVKAAMNEKLLLPSPWESKTYCMDENIFKEYFGFYPRPAQMDFIQTIQEMPDTDTQKPGIFILEAPMGIGKTEAALAGAQLLANRTSAGGVFFGLPTQATANGIFERLIPWAEKQSEDTMHAIRLAHGMADFDPKYQSLFQGVSQFADDEPEESRLYAHTWFRGKKQAILANFVVGTVDQLLLSVLKKKHVMLRHLGMAGKIAIIDECHAYDVFTSQYLDRTLAWMGAYGQPVIILSATLPARRRRELVAGYLRKDVSEIPSDIEASMSYPLLTYTVGEEIRQKELKSDSAQTVLEIESLESENLAEFLESQLKEGGCAAIILNTVKRVQETAELLRKKLPDKDIFELHSRYIYPDRKQKEEELLRRMGKNSTAKERDGFILVASQVAEQSLDFDADILITELCPVDLLLQRMGREHRHKEHDLIRPRNLLKPRCMILRDEGAAYSSGSKAVYAEYLLMRTQAVLPKKIDIPADIPMLIQKVYSEDETIFKNIPGYREAEADYRKEQAKKEQKAYVYLLATPKKHEEKSKREASLDLFLNNSTNMNDRQAEAAVRDGRPSLEVLILQKREGRIAFLPWQDDQEVLNCDELPSQEICMKIAKQRLRLPASLCRRDRLGKVIDELEQRFQRDFMIWKKSPWINGELILLLDEECSAVLEGVRLHYTKEDGLTDKEETDAGSGI